MFDIMAKTSDGKVFKCFTWTRDEKSGIERAVNDGLELGYDLVRVWAEEDGEEVLGLSM